MMLFEKHLQNLCSLRVDQSLDVIFYTVDQYYRRQQRLPLRVIDEWVIQRRDRYGEDWDRQRQMKFPRMFLMILYEDYKYQAIKERQYQRGEVPPAPVSLSSEKPVSYAIDETVATLPFDQGAAYLGRLAGSWILACPEQAIFAGEHIKKVGRMLHPYETHKDWEVPQAWLDFLEKEGIETASIPKQEKQWLYVLDVAVSRLFSLYWEYNTYT